MLRKLLVNALALLAVLALAGGAMAAVSTVGEERRAEKASQTDDDDADAADDEGDAADDDADLDDDADADNADDADGFGAARSAEVAAYEECRDAAADETAADECEKPGPAWANPAHPVFGENGEKAGQTPGGAAREAAQQRRDEAGTQRPERAPGDDDADDVEDAEDAEEADDADDQDDQDVEVTAQDDRGRQQSAKAKADKGNSRR